MFLTKHSAVTKETSKTKVLTCPKQGNKQLLSLVFVEERLKALVDDVQSWQS